MWSDVEVVPSAEASARGRQEGAQGGRQPGRLPGDDKRGACPGTTAGGERKSGSRVARGGVEPPTFHFSGERYYQLSYLAVATPTGLEPATSAVTGRRANQLRYGARCVTPARGNSESIA